MLTVQEKVKSIVVGLSIGVLFGVWISLMGDVLDMPDVLISNSSGECVNVFNYNEDHVYTCENLPERYNHIWVQ